MTTQLPSERAAKLARFAAIGGGLLLLLSAALITFEVVIRKFIGVSIVGVDEITGYAFAVAMAWGFAYALFVRAHIRVDALYLRLPLGLQRILDVIALGAFAGIIGIVVYKAGGTLVESIRLGARASTPLATSLWIPQSLWLSGLLFFFVCLLLRLLDLVRAIARGDYTAALHLGAPQSLINKADQ
jgi:TRAP-type C4-dicarboxylate transport system permease small subunit